MENQIYLVYNELTRRYFNVASFATDAEAIYNLSQSLPQLLHQPLEHFRVLKVGYYNVANGDIVMYEHREELDFSSHYKVEQKMSDKGGLGNE